MLAGFFFVSAYIYLAIAGRNIPVWVWIFLAALVIYGAISQVRQTRKKVAAAKAEADQSLDRGYGADCPFNERLACAHIAGMPHAPFIPLRVVSSYSMLEGAIDPKEIAKLAKERGFPAIAMCDRNGLYGSSMFAGAAKGEGRAAHHRLLAWCDPR